MKEGILRITPAYGRRYKNSEEIITAWQAGKDFRIINGPYLSSKDADKLRDLGFTDIHVIQGPAHSTALSLEVCFSLLS